MKPGKRQFSEQLAKALGDGPGPRAVEAQKARLVAEADRQRRATRYWVVVLCAVTFVIATGLFVVLSR